jgi:hypothetical protein
MEMIVMFNVLIKCLVTGLFTALWLVLLCRMGALPIMFFSEVKEDDKEKDPYD